MLPMTNCGTAADQLKIKDKIGAFFGQKLPRKGTKPSDEEPKPRLTRATVD